MPVSRLIMLFALVLAFPSAAPGGEDADKYLAKGVSLRIEGKAREAIEPLKKAVSLAPGNAHTFVQLGAALEDSGKWEEAAQAYRRALELDPSNEAAARNREQLHAYRGLADQSRASNPSKEALMHLGLAALDQGNLDRGLALFRLCRGLMPNDPRPLFYCGLAMEKHGRTKEAISLYEQTASLYPGFGPGWTNLLVILLASGDREMAKKRGQEALRALPNDRKIRFLVEMASANSPRHSASTRGSEPTQGSGLP